MEPLGILISAEPEMEIRSRERERLVTGAADERDVEPEGQAVHSSGLKLPVGIKKLPNTICLP